MSIVDKIRIRQDFSPEGYTFEKGLEDREPEKPANIESVEFRVKNDAFLDCIEFFSKPFGETFNFRFKDFGDRPKKVVSFDSDFRGPRGGFLKEARYVKD